MDEWAVNYHVEATCFSKTTTTPSGQTIFLELQGERVNTRYLFSIYLSIASKRKNLDTNVLQTTGTDGLWGLLWAKKQILEFEDFIMAEYPDDNIVIYCGWDDNHRRNVYYRGLKNHGYKFDRIDDMKVLAKTLKRNV